MGFYRRMGLNQTIPPSITQNKTIYLSVIETITVKYFDTFTGIGGFTLGIQQAYDNRPNIRNRATNISEDLPNASEKSDRPTCIGFSEIDKYASAIYQHHFPTHKNYGDITKINAEELPDFDLLVGGFPCQAFSIAGKRKGFDDTRGTLFFDLARILRAKQPRLFVFENVKGLLSHDNGNTFRTIMSTIAELGYDAQWQVLNSKNHGVPQNRERVFIIGNRRGTRRPIIFPLVDSENRLTTLNRFGKLNVYNTDAQAGKIYTTDGISPTVSGQRVNSQGWILDEKQQITINEKVYQMSEGVSAYTRELLLGLPQSKGQELSSTQMQELFGRIRKGIQSQECFEIEREPQEVRQQSKGSVQEVETLGAFLGSADDTGGVCGVVRIPTEEMFLLWANGGNALQSFVQIQQQDTQDDDRPNRYQETLHSWKHSPLLLAVQPYQGRLLYSIGDGRDWVKIYQTKMEVICKENNLNSILEEHVDQKYFLSENAMKSVLGRIDKVTHKDLMLRDGRDNRSCLRSGRNTELGVKGLSIRRLTPLECERLQAFPDNWTNVCGTSDSQRYKCCGNAVTVSVVRDIMINLLKP